MGAFSNCDGDSVCRLRLSDLMDACAWSAADNQCNRQDCLMSVKVLHSSLQYPSQHMGRHINIVSKICISCLSYYTMMDHYCDKMSM